MPSNTLGILYTLPEEFFRHAVCPGDTVAAAQTGAVDQRSANAARTITSSAPDVDSDNAVGSTCLTCGIGGGTTAAFSSVEEQRAHFRSDWHRFNVRRKLHGRPVFTEEEFERSVQDDGELSSISGSDTDSENESDTVRLGSHAATSISHRSSEVIFVSGGQTFKVWRALLHPDLRHEELDRALLAERLLRLRQEKGQWVVLLSRGGHFAATIFNVSAARPSGQGKHEIPPYEVVMHKTFHRYVVRAKAGGRQSAKDATGKSIKSAGSALRRHNEAALERDIQDTLQAWRERLQGAALIFVHAPSGNAAALFGGEHPVLNRADSRIRSVPFTTRRPTFMETKRVVTVLLSVQSAELPPMPSADTIQPRAKAVKESPQKGKSADSAVVDPPAAPAIPDSPLHLASKEGNAEKVAQLLQKGEDPTVLDARGKPPYAVAADKDVRDAFRRYVASEDALLWDWTAAGVPSALTPEMEAQQAARQAEKKAKMREREKERKKRAAERKSKAAVESRAAAEAEVSTAAAEAAALAIRRETGASGKVKLSKGEAAAAQKREQMAAAAEARMARLQLLSQQQQLWWRICCSLLACCSDADLGTMCCFDGLLSGSIHHYVGCGVQVVLQSRRGTSGRIPGWRTSVHALAPWAVALAAVGLVVMQKKA